ncbi:hypothetical protein C5167_004093 [Papaver somniferum]|nr:hypothetical protein C5167_004093 [Papaver somniferum]
MRPAHPSPPPIHSYGLSLYSFLFYAASKTTTSTGILSTLISSLKGGSDETDKAETLNQKELFEFGGWFDG